MLKSFEISNFKSFKDKVKFDFSKTNYQSLQNTNTVDGILKGALLVGPNASGKTNSILAIKFLLDALLGNSEIVFASYMCLFSNNPIMNLCYLFEIDGVEIEYKISYQIIDEIITEDLKLNEDLVFSRNGSTATVEIGEKSVHTDVPDNALFLRNVYFNTKFQGNSVLQNWFKFMSNSIYVNVYKRNVIAYKDINVSLLHYLNNSGPDEINNFFEKNNFKQYIEYENKSQGERTIVESPEKMIYFKRSEINEPIPYVFESLGNVTLLQLLPSLFNMVENNGMLILDEFSSGFHNDLEELLVKFFMKSSERSQLFFVSHSTNLLSNSILRPDQIYSVDFDKNGSHIKRFSSEKPREAQNLEKMYLSGVFGGIPNYDSASE